MHSFLQFKCQPRVACKDCHRAVTSVHVQYAHMYILRQHSLDQLSSEDWCGYGLAVAAAADAAAVLVMQHQTKAWLQLLPLALPAALLLQSFSHS